MLSPSAKVAARIKDGLKKFKPIIENAKKRDANESDTVLLLIEMFSDIFGFDRYVDITTELAIRGTFCDIALKIEGKFCFLIEAKAVGIELKDIHTKQAIDYAANKGIDWVILTNAVSWKVYKVAFTKPIDHTLILDINFLALEHKNNDHIENLFMISKEAFNKSLLDDYFTQREATNKYIIGNLLLQDSILSALKREVKNIFPDVKISPDEILHTLKNDVLRREILEGIDCENAMKKINKAARKKEKGKEQKTEIEPQTETAITA